MTTFVEGAVSVAELVEAVRRQQALPRPLPVQGPVAPPERSVGIVAAHPGAGATAVAVAVTDAVAASGQEVMLVDSAASADAFGAVEVEIDSGAPGLRAGRRGRARVARRDWGVPVPVPGGTVTVVDGDIGPCAHHVIVCRATVPSVTKVEVLLTEGSLLAVVGATRWHRAVRAALGPAAMRATNEGRVVFVPRHRRTQMYGVDAQPTPRSSLRAASLLVGLMWTNHRSPHDSPAKGSRR